MTNQFRSSSNYGPDGKTVEMPTICLLLNGELVLWKNLLQISSWKFRKELTVPAACMWQRVAEMSTMSPTKLRINVTKDLASNKFLKIQEGLDCPNGIYVAKSGSNEVKNLNQLHPLTQECPNCCTFQYLKKKALLCMSFHGWNMRLFVNKSLTKAHFLETQNCTITAVQRSMLKDQTTLCVEIINVLLASKGPIHDEQKAQYKEARQVAIHRW